MSLNFINTHKASSKDFSRKRKLPFVNVFLLIFRKSVKSLQVMLNEFILHTRKDCTITASAFTQARKKLKHTAFSELNDDIVSLYYQDKEFKTYHGFRMLAFDASILILPKSSEVINEFGSRPIRNYTKKELGDYTSTTFEVCYDVLNNVAIKSVLGRSDSYEVALAIDMLSSVKSNDLLICDRGYVSYRFFAELAQRGINYIIRCPYSSFNEINAMFKPESPSDAVVVSTASVKIARQLRKLALPDKIKFRLVKIVLHSGEIEVLATSLLDEQQFKAEEFGELYYLRWGVETFFSKLKGRLGLENFTGKSVETIKQDFWSTIFISNLESIMTEDIEETLNAGLANGKSEKSINKSVSFNAIKNLAFDIFSTESDTDCIMDRLSKLFLMNTLVVRKGRKVDRNKVTDTRSLNYQKRARKHVF